ncbi:MAG: UDP-N-acetylmuramate--L-alanine ligase [Planctomycetes bacterium RIFCSPHIGHO2_12_FULL_52_36]|nr:MAG: UDP-N-acetylmuramate--L-alanine ligase [Planctomycetes bacterium RIFCSPHIGHO2_02_FULL_52_58]OHB92944.1 MAG: UDP-N-acetylmuramate--L-alanine ligase [Planctomycetes bacterium RIFCSPHIGHO2_12_FULL_52_36]
METSRKVLSYHLVGLGGSGMSPLAQVLLARGHRVSGSDRNLDRGTNHPLFQKLSRLGIACFPQDGSGVTEAASMVVISSAIEEDNPDVQKARELGIPIIQRASLLSILFNERNGTAIAGTNGKTTVTGMATLIMDRAGLDPTVVVGGYMKNYASESRPGNVRIGRSDVMCIEADESDGTLAYYRPKIGVITSISKDHKPLEALMGLFLIFIQNSARLVINVDCPVLSKVKLPPKETLTYGLQEKAQIRATDIVYKTWGSCFRVGGVNFELKVPGRHNILNALAAVAACSMGSVTLEKAAEALGEFQGIGRRLDLVGETHGIKVIDDFAHNPDKIQAALETVKQGSGRVFVVYQPHGFGPTKFMKEELIEVFSRAISKEDALFMPEILYLGGTARKDISSQMLVQELVTRGVNAHYLPERSHILGLLMAEVRPGDTVLVMGARDDTLTDFCHEILTSLHRNGHN